MVKRLHKWERVLPKVPNCSNFNSKAMVEISKLLGMFVQNHTVKPGLSELSLYSKLENPTACIKISSENPEMYRFSLILNKIPKN